MSDYFWDVRSRAHTRSFQHENGASGVVGGNQSRRENAVNRSHHIEGQRGHPHLSADRGISSDSARAPFLSGYAKRKANEDMPVQDAKRQSNYNIISGLDSRDHRHASTASKRNGLSKEEFLEKRQTGKRRVLSNDQHLRRSYNQFVEDRINSIRSKPDYDLLTKKKTYGDARGRELSERMLKNPSASSNKERSPVKATAGVTTTTNTNHQQRMTSGYVNILSQDFKKASGDLGSKRVTSSKREGVETRGTTSSEYRGVDQRFSNRNVVYETSSEHYDPGSSLPDTVTFINDGDVVLNPRNQKTPAPPTYFEVYGRPWTGGFGGSKNEEGGAAVDGEGTSEVKPSNKEIQKVPIVEHGSDSEQDSEAGENVAELGTVDPYDAKTKGNATTKRSEEATRISSRLNRVLKDSRQGNAKNVRSDVQGSRSVEKLSKEVRGGQDPQRAHKKGASGFLPPISRGIDKARGGKANTSGVKLRTSGSAIISRPIRTGGFRL